MYGDIYVTIWLSGMILIIDNSDWTLLYKEGKLYILMNS